MNDDELAARRRRLGLPLTPIEARDAFRGIDRSIATSPTVWDAPTPQQVLADFERGRDLYARQMGYRWDPVMDASVHPNCRCVATPLLPRRRWPRILLGVLIGLTCGIGLGLLILLLVRACRR